MHNARKILQQMLQDFQSVSSHFETFCITWLSLLENMFWKVAFQKFFVVFRKLGNVELKQVVSENI